MAPFDLKSYARRGAEARLNDLNSELESIYAAFPDLRPAGRARRGRGKAVVNHEEQATGGRTAARVRRRKPMTAAQRKAVGERMKKYWAARKAAKK